MMWQKFSYDAHDAAAIRLPPRRSYCDVTTLPLHFKSTAMSLRKFWAGPNNRREVAIMKIPMRFYYNLGASTTILAASATILVVLAKISNRSGIAAQGFNIDNICL